MNKKILGVVVVVLVAVGGFLFFSPSSPLKSGSMMSGGLTGTSFSSIQDALSRSLSLECTFTDEDGNKTVSYMKNKAVRATITDKDGKVNDVIVKDTTMWTWSGKEGMTMTFEKSVADVTDKAAQTQFGKNMSQVNVMDVMEKYKNSCKPTTVADSYFTPPTDVVFQDLSEMTKQFQDVMKKPASETINEESIQQMMQKYGSGQ